SGCVGRGRGASSAAAGLRETAGSSVQCCSGACDGRGRRAVLTGGRGRGRAEDWLAGATPSLSFHVGRQAEGDGGGGGGGGGQELNLNGAAQTAPTAQSSSTRVAEARRVAGVEQRSECSARQRAVQRAAYINITSPRGPNARTASIISTAGSDLGSMRSLAAPRAALAQPGTRCALLAARCSPAAATRLPALPTPPASPFDGGPAARQGCARFETATACRRPWAPRPARRQLRDRRAAYHAPAASCFCRSHGDVTLDCDTPTPPKLPPKPTARCTPLPPFRAL
ncbi:hypothetical protein SVAN01_11577, partial [Stagonosporopsis vannaccii]